MNRASQKIEKICKHKKLLKQKKFSGFIGKKALFLALLLLLAAPASAKAFSISSIIKNIFKSFQNSTEASAASQETSPIPFSFLSAVPNNDPDALRNSADIYIVGDTSIAPVLGPLGNSAEAAESSTSFKISVYTVRQGDTISDIAHSFGVSVSTIRWANDIPRGGTIKIGQELIILPVSGVQHTVAKGDSIASIAKKYGGDPDDIYDFNGLTSNDVLAVGTVVIIPDGEVAERTTVIPSRPIASGPDLGGYYARPLAGGTKTRGIHGYNGVDLAAPLGTPVYASASGQVITVRDSGWNGGYGKYVVISHANGTQTLYAHLSDAVAVRGSISKGQVLGYVGSTGKSTGPHLHFEVRGAKNPF